jgi:hypothetical protein
MAAKIKQTTTEMSWSSRTNLNNFISFVKLDEIFNVSDWNIRRTFPINKFPFSFIFNRNLSNKQLQELDIFQKF